MARNGETEGNDVFFGTSNRDDLIGAGGDDIFYGGGGSDTLKGDSGNDTFFITYERARNIYNLINGGSGVDTLSIDFSTSQEQTGLVFSSASSSTDVVDDIDLALPEGGNGFRLRYLSVENIRLIGTSKADRLVAGSGKSFLQGREGDDTYTFAFPSSIPQAGAGSKIRDTSGNDTLILETRGNGAKTPLQISLANPQSGTIGLKRDETALIIDLNGDGVINRAQDFAILDFFQGNQAGTGFIEKVGNLNGNDILNANRDFISVGADFDSDRKADLLWRNADTGENVVWRLDGTSLVGSDSLFTVPDRNWTMGGTGDFNHDGETDIAWRNSATGENVIWFMEGTSIAETGLMQTVSDRNWTMSGTGDFNGDGNTDLAWRNYATGENAIWLMDGAQVAVADYKYTTPVENRNWVMSSAGDFNGDNRADILWRNSVTGENAVWFMEGAQLKDWKFLTPVADQNWKIGQTADFNQDGKTDIAWRNGSAGRNAVWLMNGTELDQGLLIAPLQGSSWNLPNSRSPSSLISS